MRFAELYAKSNFSFLEAASHPEELVRRAAELGYAAIGVADRNSLAGVVRAHMAAKDTGIKLLVGAEITPVDAPPVVLLATDRAAYGRLSRLITRGRRRAEKGECRIEFGDVAEHAEGLIAGVLMGEGRDCECEDCKLEIENWKLKIADSSGYLHRFREAFGERCYLLGELHHGADDENTLDRMIRLSRKARVPLVASGGVRYHVPERQALLDVLTAVRHGLTVSAVRRHLFANADRYLKPPEEMAALFARAPEAVRRTVEIADRCKFSLDDLRYEYPKELAPEGETPMEYLTRLAWKGARKRYPRGVPQKVRGLVKHELALIEELHYEAYFLTVWDLVRFARRRGILCQGRGSAANSVVCYCLGITSVDPDRIDLLFERFVSRERNEAPDIDVDFEHERREEVLQYLYNKYGRERAGITGEVITYRPRSAVRDVGKALGLSLDRVDRLAKRIERFHTEPELADRCREAGIDPDSTVGRQLVELVDQLVGFPRHLSQHTGGMVITRGPLCELVPIENAAMDDRTVIQWNKDDLDELGILKIDCLALGMLTAIRKCFALIEQHHGRSLTLANVPPEDPDVYAMIGRADTMGVFQIESRAQMNMLPRLRPRCFYDLVIEVAIVRPGPIQGNMVHPYLRRRNGEEEVTYPSDEVRQVLEKTLGVPLFQEQAMRLAVVAAGFTPGEADQLRRAMGAWRRPGVIDKFHQKLIHGMRAKGFSEEYAEAIFNQIRGFGDYGFPESHAASFALLVYVSCWLKYHYAAAFTAALLNSQPLGFYAPAQLVRNAREHDVEVLPVDVNHSDWDCTLEEERKAESGELPNTAHCPLPTHHYPLRLGFRMLRGMSESHARRIEECRTDGPFRSLDEFTRRTGLSRAVSSRLAKAGTFGSLELNRRQALWDALGQDQEELPLFDQSSRVRETHQSASSLPKKGATAGLSNSAKQDLPQSTAGQASSGTRSVGSQLNPQGARVDLPRMSAAEEVLADYRSLGLSLDAHPMQFLRAGLDELGVARAEQLKVLPNNRPVGVAGIVLVRQRPGTAKGITFVTLEDETGTANLIIRQNVWKRFRDAALGANVLLAQGRLQRRGRVIHVIATKLENLSDRMRELTSKSRDWM